MMPPAASPAQVANLAQNMARNAEATDARMFQKIALVSCIVSCGVMAFSAGVQAWTAFAKQSRNYDRDESVRHQR